jgi:hypothetical protein
LIQLHTLRYVELSKSSSATNTMNVLSKVGAVVVDTFDLLLNKKDLPPVACRLVWMFRDQAHRS